MWIKTSNSLQSKQLKSLKIYKANLKTLVASSLFLGFFKISLCKHFPGRGTLDIFFPSAIKVKICGSVTVASGKTPSIMRQTWKSQRTGKNFLVQDWSVRLPKELNYLAAKWLMQFSKSKQNCIPDHHIKWMMWGDLATREGGRKN